MFSMTFNCSSENKGSVGVIGANVLGKPRGPLKASLALSSFSPPSHPRYPVPSSSALMEC